MSNNKDKTIFEKIGSLIAILVGCASLASGIGGYYILQYRVSAAEVSIKDNRDKEEELAAALQEEKELFIGLDKDIKSLQKSVDRLSEQTFRSK